jgi:7-cyano-7-deazaguanine synthase in queuosine biosynthesis
MKNKLSFVLWSGGLDSSYLVQKLLDEDRNRKVITGYVELLNNRDKSIAEKRARQAMIPIFEKKYGNRFSDLGIIYKAEVCVHNHWSPLVQMPIWFNSLIASTPPEATEVCLGYVMNDCAISYLNELKAMFRCFSKNISIKPFPKVLFPLSKECKEDFVYRINDELRPHVTWCEMPRIEYTPEPKRKKKNTIYGSPQVKSITPCGHCNSCQPSPILKYSQPVKCGEKFVETYNKDKDQKLKEVLDDLANLEREMGRGQEFFEFYVNYGSCELSSIDRART